RAAAFGGAARAPVVGALLSRGDLPGADHASTGRSRFSPESSARNRIAAITQMNAAAISTGAYPKRSSSAPAPAAAIACAAHTTRNVSADALLRSAGETRSINSVYMPGSLIYWAA